MALSLADPDELEEFELKKPDAVVVVEPEKASSLLPDVDQNTINTSKEIAKSFTKDIVSVTPKSIEYDNKIQDIMTLASAEIQKTADAPNRMLQRASSSALGGTSGKSNANAQQKAAGSLAELRVMMDDLTPNGAELTPAKKILGFIPGGKKALTYFQKYQTAETQLAAITKSLMTSQDELRKDNAFLKEEKRKLLEGATELSGYAYLAKVIEAELETEINSLKSRGDMEKANALETDVLYYVKQRHQDIMTQIAVSVQAVLAMDLIRKTNVELIKGVERARTTTLAALRTAITVAEALTNQKMVLDQIDGLNAATNNAIAATSAMLKENTGRVYQQSASSGVDPKVLEDAFSTVISVMDEIDDFKKSANVSMTETTNALEAQIKRARPYLEKAQREESINGAHKGQIGS